ncbi:RNA polymerase sigma factor [Actinomadura nitritigenes]|uniref:RNA polymerase sigma factor n=1 Tax=Actinomadura nitritigenes TaxID=134602 RepID=UPI003D8A427A
MRGRAGGAENVYTLVLGGLLLPEPSISRGAWWRLTSAAPSWWHEPERFALLYDRYFDDIHRYLAARLGRENADDLAAETFLIAFRRRKDFDASRGGTFRPWLYGIATNLVSRHRRTEQRRLKALGTEDRSIKVDGSRSGSLLPVETRWGSRSGSRGVRQRWLPNWLPLRLPAWLEVLKDEQDHIWRRGPLQRQPPLVRIDVVDRRTRLPLTLMTRMPTGGSQQFDNLRIKNPKLSHRSSALSVRCTNPSTSSSGRHLPTAHGPRFVRTPGSTAFLVGA